MMNVQVICINRYVVQMLKATFKNYTAITDMSIEDTDSQAHKTALVPKYIISYPPYQKYNLTIILLKIIS